MIKGFINYLKRDDTDTEEKFGVIFLLVTIIIALMFAIAGVREDIINPCLEYETEIVCSGVGDAYDCSEVYVCLKRKND